MYYITIRRYLDLLYFAVSLLLRQRQSQCFVLRLSISDLPIEGPSFFRT